MVKLKKGVFYTISGFFLVSLVLILSILVTTAVNQSNQRLTEAGGFERIISIDESLVKTINNLDNGLTITIQDNSDEDQTIKLSIVETLNQNFSTYNENFFSQMDELANYVESDQPEINFNLNRLYNSTNKLNLLIKPNSLAYTHINSNNKPVITIIPRYVDYEADSSEEPYTISGTPLSNAVVSIKLINVNLTGSNKVSWVTQNSGSDLNLTIVLTDSANYSETHNYALNANLINRFTLNGAGGPTINVSSLCNSCIQIDKGSFNITSNFSTNLDSFGETVTANYPQGLYTINFSNLGIYVNKAPRIV